MTEARIVLHELADGAAEQNVKLPLPLLVRVWGKAAVRKTVLFLLLAAAWEAYGRYLNQPLLFPTLSETLGAGYHAILDGTLPRRTLTTLRVLVSGYAIGISLAAILTFAATATRIGTDLLEMLTAMFNPLPAIALLPLALLWFGLGTGSLIFVLIHTVVWALALNTHAGFLGVSQTLRMVGRNYGLTGVGYVARILVPAAFPSILTGLKIGWAFGWRTLIAAELVFGVSSGQGGIGWFIYESKSVLDIPSVFAGLLTIILIGLAVENVVFRSIERATVRRWGVQN